MTNFVPLDFHKMKLFILNTPEFPKVCLFKICTHTNKFNLTIFSNLDEQADGVWGVEELCKLPKENGGATEAAAAAIKFRLESMAFIATNAGDMHPENKSMALSNLNFHINKSFGK